MNSKIMVFWGLIIILICSSLIIISNTSKDKVLIRLERTIKSSANEYFKENDLVPKFNNTNVVYIDELIEKEYLEYEENIDKYCIDSIRITNKLIYNKFEVVKECDQVLRSAN